MKVFNFIHPKTREMVYATSVSEAAEILLPLQCDAVQLEGILGMKLRYLLMVYPDLLGSIRAGLLGQEAQAALELSDSASELLYSAMLHFNS
tara:strand:- start:81 stop:356 length:276 start_codon:yes stop_codon:yes gene_type:complete